MTIAIGMLASDGIVVAADSQVTIGEGKVSQGKMRAGVYTDGNGNIGSCIIAGAGTVPHMKSCAEILAHTFSADHGRVGDQLRQALASNLKSFHKEHIFPVPSDERPSIEFIIAAERNHRPMLWQSAITVISDGTPYAAIGHGSQLARSILEKLYRLPLLDVWQSVILAAYVLFQVKESDIYCGGHTDIFYIKNNRFDLIDRRFTNRLDAVLSDYGEVIESGAFRHVVGAEPSTRAPEEGTIRDLFTVFMEELSGSSATSSSRDQA